MKRWNGWFMYQICFVLFCVFFHRFHDEFFVWCGAVKRGEIRSAAVINPLSLATVSPLFSFLTGVMSKGAGPWAPGPRPIARPRVALVSPAPLFYFDWLIGWRRGSTAVPKQFQSGSKAVPTRFHCNFEAVSVRFERGRDLRSKETKVTINPPPSPRKKVFSAPESWLISSSFPIYSMYLFFLMLQ